MSGNGSPREAYASQEWQKTPSNTSETRGIVLVFDLDDTIAHSDENIFTRQYNRNGAYLEQIQINPQILEILQRAEALKASGQVAGIFLYTNNSSTLYINLVHYKLRKLLEGITPTTLTSVPKMEFGFTPIFDDILSRNDPRRSDKRNTPYKTKTWADIQMLCEENKISTAGLEARTYFFDDQVHPDLQTHLGNHYFLIGSHIPSLNNNSDRFLAGFSRNNPSNTNLSEVRRALGLPAGGRRRKNRTRKYKKRATRRR